MTAAIAGEIGGELASALDKFVAGGAGRAAAAYRCGPMSVCVRFVDPTFDGADLETRVVDVYDTILAEVDAEERDDIIQVLAFTPKESRTLGVSLLFDEGFERARTRPELLEVA